jgi:predicted amidohydrolase
MRLGVAQTRPVTADIEANIARHKELIAVALAARAEAVVFPELSLTGYEPALAKQLACDPNDHNFRDFQRIADDNEIIIGVGVPTRSPTGNCISMILFQPHQHKQVYSKKYLHRDEEEFFVSGENFSVLRLDDTNIAPAICYEISIPEHVKNAYADGADVYIASVNKSVTGIDQAIDRLAEIASSHSMTVLMSNCAGFCDGYACAGKTSIWNDQGSLVGQLNDRSEGILIFDTVTQEIIERGIN